MRSEERGAGGARLENNSFLSIPPLLSCGPMARSDRFVITRGPQLRALASSTRQEVLDVLARLGTASVAQIAGALGRPADGIYYHLRVLRRVGLVTSPDGRSRAGRMEALFRTRAPEMVLGYGASPERNARAVTRIVASMLRLGVRDFRSSFASGHVRVKGPRRELWALRTTGWLSPAAVADLNRRIKGITRAAARTRRGRRLYGITILLTPLDHRARRARRSLSTRPRREPR
jgi:DNA-binding transcriptional ArsR family regulator